MTQWFKCWRPFTPSFSTMILWALSLEISASIIPKLVFRTGECPRETKHQPLSRKPQRSANTQSWRRSKVTSTANWKHPTHQTIQVKQNHVLSQSSYKKSSPKRQINSPKFLKMGNSGFRRLTLLERSSESLRHQADMSKPINFGQSLTTFYWI